MQGCAPACRASPGILALPCADRAVASPRPAAAGDMEAQFGPRLKRARHLPERERAAGWLCCTGDVPEASCRDFAWVEITKEQANGVCKLLQHNAEVGHRLGMGEDVILHA